MFMINYFHFKERKISIFLIFINAKCISSGSNFDSKSSIRYYVIIWQRYIATKCMQKQTLVTSSVVVSKQHGYLELHILSFVTAWLENLACVSDWHKI